MSPRGRAVAAFVAAMLTTISFAPAVRAAPNEVECPLAFPDDPKLRFVGANLEQAAPDGLLRQPTPDETLRQSDGTVRVITHYASFRFHRNAILVCKYNVVQDGRIVGTDTGRMLEISMPGILMRCEGIFRERPRAQFDDWIRRWCVHEPDM
ncbi:MAG: hypothetical protein GC202_12210 [Alphaproteobacteria bacterium]|nr:hypothetical protein [Alphaproteobacteria bacterium]